jgi:putative SOS response-associated peptidase YedK
MCGRYTLHTEKEALAERFGFDPADLEALAPRYNIAPTDPVVAVRVLDGVRRAGRLRWGLVPYWARAIGALPLMINARVEGIAEKPAFREPLRRQRCLIPADGFYEWQAAGALAKRKLPHWIGLARGGPFAMAGIWSRWRPKDELGAEPLYSCAILTTAANAAVAPLHDRMPVILPREAEARWLDPALDDDVDALLALLQPIAPDALASHPVSARVNSVKNDDASLLDPSSEDPQLGFGDVL